HDVVEGFERIHHLPRKDRGVAVVTGIPRRLSTTRLRARHFDLAAGLFEQFHGRKADARTHQIDETGDEQADVGTCTHVAAGLRRCASCGDFGAPRGRFTRDGFGDGTPSPSRYVISRRWRMKCWRSPVAVSFSNGTG